MAKKKRTVLKQFEKCYNPECDRMAKPSYDSPNWYCCNNCRQGILNHTFQCNSVQKAYTATLLTGKDFYASNPPKRPDAEFLAWIRAQSEEPSEMDSLLKDLKEKCVEPSV